MDQCTGAWLRGAGKRLLLETKKGLAHPKKEREGKKCQEKPIFRDLKTRIRVHKASSKADRLFLTK